MVATVREDGHSYGSGEIRESHGHQGHRVHEGHLLGHAIVVGGRRVASQWTMCSMCSGSIQPAKHRCRYMTSLIPQRCCGLDTCGTEKKES